MAIAKMLGSLVQKTSLLMPALLVGSGAVLAGGPVLAAGAAGGDGPPSLSDAFTPTPQTHRPGGGGAVRIYGSGFLGTTSVTIGAAAAPKFRVVDSKLIIATVPPANVPLVQNDGFAHIAITDDQGTATTDLDHDGVVDTSDCTTGCAAFGPELGAIFYTDATLTVTPSTGLDGGETATMTLTGHRPNQGGWPFVELNPLVNFLEDGPQDPDVAPPGPPYGAPLTFAPTDANGNASASVTVAASPTFNAKDQDYDADADCPVAQITADYGLDKCILGYSEFGMASLEHYVSFNPDAPNLDPIPAAPTMTLSRASGPSGARVTVSGVHWNAAPHFGSSTNPIGPGESPLTIEICNPAQTVCAPAAAPAANVTITRYRDGDLTNPCTSGIVIPCIQPSYSGATLSGSFTVPSAPACAPSCIVRVRQQRYDIEANAPAPGSFITATAAFAVRRPAVADFDGDGTTDRSVYDNGAWYVQNQPTGFWGLSGYLPVPGDYNGDGKADRAVYRDGAWYVEGMPTVFWGLPGDVPVPADYDGDGKTDRAVYRDGGWYVQGQSPVFLGLAGYIPVPADYDGDGKAEPAVYRDGAWYVQNQPTVFWGLAGYVPVPGDYDGDGKTDRAVYRDGAWYVQGQATAFWGLPGHIPLPLPQAIYQRFF